MSEQLRCTLSFDSVDELRATLTSWTQGQSCFVPYPDELPDGSEVLVRLELGERVTLELHCTVLQPDFDEKGNTGVAVKLLPDSEAAAQQTLKELRLPSESAIFRTTRSGKRHGDTLTLDTVAEEDENPTLEPGTLLEERFQIEAHLATGGMGEVYRAVHIHLKRPVALKLLRKSLATDMEMWARFKREAELVSQLESPHIVRVFDFGKTQQGQPFLAMEYVEGQTLDEAVHTGPMEPDRVVRILTQVCDGLAEAHAQGIIHRDLKPANIMLGKRRDGMEVAKILDFGIARLADRKLKGDEGLKTQTGLVVGTPAYLAPEQALAGELDERTDIYALGCVTYELLTGQPPFIADDIAKVIALHVTAEPTHPGKVRPALLSHPAVCGLVLKCLSKDKAARFQTVAELRKALEGVGSTRIVAPSLGSDGWSAPAGDVASVPSDQSWPPPMPSSPSSPGLPAVAAVPAADDFFSMRAATRPSAKPAVKGALQKSLKALGIEVPRALVEKLEARRDALCQAELTVVLMWVQVLGPAPRTEGYSAAVARTLEMARAWGAAIDVVDEDGLLLLFSAGSLGVAGTHAAAAALDLRDAVLEDAARSSQAPASIRAALTSLDLRVTPEPLEGAPIERVRGFAGPFPTGSLVVDRPVALELLDTIELRALRSDVQEIVGRRTHLKRNAVGLVGRDAVLGSLDRRLASLGQGVVSPFVVRGARGSGRSTVLEELAARGRSRGFVVGIARGVEALRHEPFGAVTEIICNVCGVSVEERTSRMRPALERIGLTGPQLEGVLAVSGVSQLPQRFTAGQVVQALRAVLRQGAAERGVLLLFDGLETVDEHSLEAFSELVTRAAARELTVGFAEPSLPAERIGSVPAIELPALTTSDIATALRALVEGAPSTQLVEFLAQRSRGLPARLINWLWYLDDRGHLRSHDGSVTLNGEVADLDDDTLTLARLESMPLEVRRALEAVAVVGDPFDAPTLSTAYPRANATTFQRVALSRMIRPLGGRKWTLASQRVVQAVMRVVTAERASMHQRVATAMIEQGRADPSSVDPSRVAGHLTRGGDGVRAVPLWKHATEVAFARRGLHDAVLCIRGWSDALGKVPNPTQDITRARVDGLARAAGISIALQDAGLARSLVDEAQTLARPASIASGELMLSLARVHRSEARRARAAEALAEAEKLGAHSPMSSLVEAERAESREQEGDLAAAVTAYEAALRGSEPAKELARWHGEIDLTARLEARLAGVHHLMKNIDQARRLYESSLGRWRQANWPFAEARVLSNLGTLSMHAKDPPSAARFFSAAASAASRSGDFLFQCRMLLQQSKALKKSESPDAKRFSSEARRIALMIGWEDGRVQAESL